VAAIACLTAFAWTAASGAATLSFEDARAALHVASDLQKAGEANVTKNEYSARAADSLGLPEISVNATQIFGIKTGTIATPIGTVDFSQNLHGPRASVNGTWAIYTGGRITATQRALAAGTDQARAELKGSEENLDLQLTQVYFGVELASNVERTYASILEAADRHLARATRFEERGAIAKVERLNAQVARDEVARDLVRAHNETLIAQARLQRLLHRTDPIEPGTSLFVITRSIDSLPEWVTAAEHQNPVLAAFDAKREQAKQGIVIAEAAWKPEVFAFGSYGLIKHYQTIVEPNWIAGIGVNFTLFSREDRGSKVNAAREALNQVQSLQDEARNLIDTAVETSYRKVDQAREQFQLLDSSLVAARENLRLRERGFDEGQATSLDVNDARTAVARAATGRAAAAYDFVVALAQLLEASGQAYALPEYIQRADIRLQS
jgi:outer membrane protein TolC